MTGGGFQKRAASSPLASATGGKAAREDQGRRVTREDTGWFVKFEQTWKALWDANYEKPYSKDVYDNIMRRSLNNAWRVYEEEERGKETKRNYEKEKRKQEVEKRKEEEEEKRKEEEEEKRKEEEEKRKEEEEKKKQEEGKKEKADGRQEEMIAKIVAKEFAKLSDTLLSTIQASTAATPQPQLSYAEATSQPAPPEHRRRQHTVTVLLCAEERESDAEFKKTKMKLGQIASKEGTSIMEIRQSRKCNAVLSFESAEDRDKARKFLKDEKLKTWDEEDREVPLHAKGLRAKKGNEEEVEKDLKEKNPPLKDTKFIWLARQKDDEEYSVPKILTNRTTARALLNKQRITSSDYDSFRIELWKIRPQSCQNCLQFSHSKKACTNQKRCQFCAQVGHLGDECPKTAPPGCFWCWKVDKPDNHSADHNCPTHQEKATKLDIELRKFVDEP